jgi:hypothetical protein
MKEIEEIKEINKILSSKHINSESLSKES